MDIETIKNWANQNQGYLAIILFLATMVIGWASGLFRLIFSRNQDRTPHISAGGNIKAGGNISVGNKIFNQKSGNGSHNYQGEKITVNQYGDDK